MPKRAIHLRGRPDALRNIPGRIFLDTCTLNFILDNGEAIFDRGLLSPTMSLRAGGDVEALRCLFLTGQRASWQLAISPFSYAEVVGTRDPGRRRVLESWFFEVWHYWLGIVCQQNDLPSFGEAEEIRVGFLSSTVSHALRDLPDRILLSDALAYRADCFCTRDWSTILSVRERLASLPIEVLTPTEWWERASPHASLW